MPSTVGPDVIEPPTLPLQLLGGEPGAVDDVDRARL